jgi:hypothetical protein
LLVVQESSLFSLHRKIRFCPFKRRFERLPLMGKRHEAKGKNHLLLDCQLMRSTLTSVRREGRHILVINSGSSSLKFSLLDVKSEAVIASGIAERLGTAEAFLKFSAESSACFVIPTNEELMIARQTTALALQGQNRTTNDK